MHVHVQQIFIELLWEVFDNMESSPEKVRSYMEALEEERRKIQVFQRELPLCLDLVTQAIEACKQRLSGTTSSMVGTNGQVSECSEQNSMEGHPVLEEFIPIKRTSSSDDHHERDEEEEEDDDDDENDGGNEQHSGNYGDSDEKKSNWLKSVQLWNPNPEAITHDDEDSPSPPRFRGSVLDGKANSGVFRRSPIVEKVAGKSSLSSGKDAAAPLLSAAAAAASSTAEKGGGATGNREEKQRPSTRRKPRRCWSVDLHRRFVHAVQQLGGPHVATPKQIKELMNVEDLTSDEVKSHLQKYRLHSRSSPRHNSGNAQPPQFVVVGGIWVPPPPLQYAAVAAATNPGAARGTYAPVVAAVPPEAAQTGVVWASQEKPLGSGSQGFEAHGSSNSTTTSTSAHTVTVC